MSFEVLTASRPTHLFVMLESIDPPFLVAKQHYQKKVKSTSSISCVRLHITTPRLGNKSIRSKGYKEHTKDSPTELFAMDPIDP